MPPYLNKVVLKLEIWLRARMLPFQIGNRSLARVLRVAESDPIERLRGTDPDLISKYAIRLTRNPILMRNNQCLRTGVLGYTMLRRAGHEPQLWFGLEDKSLEQEALEAHCWVVLDGKSVIDDQHENMTVIHIHPQGAAEIPPHNSPAQQPQE